MFKNILQYLENTSPRLPQKVAFSDGDMNLTFAQVQSISQSLGTALCQGGYTREPVLLLLDRSPLAVAATFGVIYAGCYYVVLDPEMPPARMGQIADTMKARVLLYDAKNAKKDKFKSTRHVATALGVCVGKQKPQKKAKSGK